MNALPIPRLTRAEAAQARRCSTPRASLPLADAGRLRRRSDEAAEAATDIRLTLRLGDQDFWHVLVPRGLIEQSVCALDPALRFETFPEDLAALLLETAARDDLDRLEALCGKPVAIAALARGIAGTPAAHRFMVEHGAHRWHVAVAPADGAPATATGVLEDLMQRWPLAPRPMPRLPMPAMVRLGTTWLTHGAVASLRPGDVVLAQFTEAAGARLVIAESLLAAARQAEGRWILTQTPTRARQPDRREWTMQDDTDAVPRDPAIRDLDEVPLQLVFDLGSVAMTLGELRTLGVGAVIELNRDLAQLVRISAHGALVGQGELVEVDGHVGVRIARLLDHD